MAIEWNKVTRLSQIVAVVLFLAVFALGFTIGRMFENKAILGEPNVKAVFSCPDGTKIKASFYDRMVRVEMPGQKLLLPQTISGSGARYANKSESFVFWNKGDMASIEQTGAPILSDCVVE